MILVHFFVLPEHLMVNAEISFKMRQFDRQVTDTLNRLAGAGILACNLAATTFVTSTCKNGKLFKPAVINFLVLVYLLIKIYFLYLCTP